MIRVFSEKDKVILDLGGRRRDVLLGCLEALNLAEAMEQNAAIAEKEPPEIMTGEVWDLKVESFDGMVAMRFTPPLLGNPTRVPMPADVARKIAKIIRFKESFARHGMRLVLQEA